MTQTNQPVFTHIRWHMLAGTLTCWVTLAIALRCESEQTGDSKQTLMIANNIQHPDIASGSAMAPSRTIRLLFIHHSCGGQLLADAGPDCGTNCIYTTHPNGGGLRQRLENSRYEVHEASYESKIGDNTDIFDWPSKFRHQMDQILKCQNQDEIYPNEIQNEIVIFKSCFPNNQFISAGTEPGNPSGPVLTVSNAKAAYNTLLDEFQKYPKVLFICVTAPPLCGDISPAPAWKKAADRLFGRTRPTPESATLARQFNDWLSYPDGWLKAYPASNIAVFDYYNILTGNGQSNFTMFPAGNGHDSHPNRDGNEKAAEALVPFLNQAVHRWQEHKAITR